MNDFYGREPEDRSQDICPDEQDRCPDGKKKDEDPLPYWVEPEA